MKRVSRRAPFISYIGSRSYASIIEPRVRFIILTPSSFAQSRNTS